MFAEPFETEDGHRIWLDQQEVSQLIAQADDQDEEIAFTLAVRSGLRVKEIVGVQSEHVVTTSAGPRVRVYDSKGKKYRETPTTQSIESTARAYEKMDGPTAYLVEPSKRTIQRRLDRVTDELAAEHDEMWQYVTMHDLRRTWATALAAADVDPLLVCDWGGWSDLETFLEHYRGTYSPDAQRRELNKVEWLSDGGAKRQSADRDPDAWMVETAAE